MKLRQIAAATALAVGAAACNSTTSLADGGEKTRAKGAEVTAAHSAEAPTSTATHASDEPKPTNGPLGPEYKTIDSFADFRKKLLADGWKPVVNPHCPDELIGADYKDYCGKYPDDISCRACDMAPEIFTYTSQGYLTARYTKNEIPLYVLAYGDIRDLDQPGKYGLVVTAWDYKPIN